MLNKSWEIREDEIVGQANDLSAALVTARKVFGERDEVRKWNGANFERRINRAVFDIITYYFSYPEVRDAALKHAEEVKERFKYICTNDRDFVTSIEQTTKSREANRIRFNTWATELS